MANMAKPQHLKTPSRQSNTHSQSDGNTTRLHTNTHALSLSPAHMWDMRRDMWDHIMKHHVQTNTHTPTSIALPDTSTHTPPCMQMHKHWEADVMGLAKMLCEQFDGSRMLCVCRESIDVQQTGELNKLFINKYYEDKCLYKSKFN